MKRGSMVLIVAALSGATVGVIATVVLTTQHINVMDITTMDSTYGYRGSYDVPRP